MSTPITADAPVSTSTAKPRELAAGRAFLGALAGGAVGAVGNVVLYYVALAAGVTMVGQFDPNLPPTTLPLFPVIAASLVPAIPAGGVLVALNAFLRKPSTAFVVLSVVLGLLSMGGPASLVGADVGTKVVLGLMHVVSAVAIVALALRMGRAKR